jgi:two-component system, NtrC family, response regulator AtoC
MPTETSATTLIEAEVHSWFVWGESAAVQPLNRLLLELASTKVPFLLLGESGTGKDAYAQALHAQAGLDGGQFRKVICAGVTPQQLREELESHKDGGEEKVGTIFFDEVEMLSAECQRQLLTYLSDAGAHGMHSASRRVVCATTCDLEREVAEGKFRRELYFRLNGACLRLPPLRERSEDIPALAAHFLKRHAEELGKVAPHLNQETSKLLVTYPWPGNIRELENVTRKMVALGDAELALNDLRVARMVTPGRAILSKASSLKMASRAASRQTERELILGALQRTKWNRKRAAQELQISYKSLLYKLKQIETPGTKSEE